MVVETQIIKIKSEKENDMIDLSERVSEIILNSEISNEIITIFVGSSTGSITIEYEPGLIKDFPDMFSRIAPKNIEYNPDEMWHDGNGHSHVKASLIGPITIPIINNKLHLGNWQQIVFVEFDVRNRTRNLVFANNRRINGLT